MTTIHYMPEAHPTDDGPMTCDTCGRTFPNQSEEFGHDCERLTPRWNRADFAGTDFAGVESAPRYGEGSGSARKGGNFATPAQVAYLVKLGMDEDEAKGLTKSQASTQIDVRKTSADTAARSNATERTNRYDGRCATCGQTVPAETGALTQANGQWIVNHKGGCPAKPEPTPQAAAADGYEAAKGDVHVIDGDYYRVHVGQTSGRPYAVKADIVAEAEWAEDGKLLVAGIVNWVRVPGLVTKLTKATLATATEAAAFGHLAGRCCFCSTPIDTPESTTVGYGPSCASKYGLPWGKNVSVAS